MKLALVARSWVDGGLTPVTRANAITIASYLTGLGRASRMANLVSSFSRILVKEVWWRSHPTLGILDGRLRA